MLFSIPSYRQRSTFLPRPIITKNSQSHRLAQQIYYTIAFCQMSICIVQFALFLRFVINFIVYFVQVVYCNPHIHVLLYNQKGWYQCTRNKPWDSTLKNLTKTNSKWRINILMIESSRWNEVDHQETADMQATRPREKNWKCKKANVLDWILKWRKNFIKALTKLNTVEREVSHRC